MSNLEEKAIKVRKFRTLEDYEDFSENISEEVIEIEEFDAHCNLEENGFFRIPNYITYNLKSSNFDEFMASLGKNKKKKLKRGIAQAQDLKLVKEEKVSKENFEKWYELYKKSISEKDLGILAVKEDWLEKNGRSLQKVGVYVFEGEKMVGGILAKGLAEDNVLPKRLSISFSAIEKEYKSKAIGEFLNATIIDFAKELGYPHVTRGRDTNLYGKHLSTGIPVFKTSLGFEMLPYKRKPDILIRFNSIDGFKSKVFFVSYDKQGIRGNLILKDKDENPKEFLFDFLTELRVYDKEMNLIRTLSQE